MHKQAIKHKQAIIGGGYIFTENACVIPVLTHPLSNYYMFVFRLIHFWFAGNKSIKKLKTYLPGVLLLFT